jgi:hypothetical protein
MILHDGFGHETSHSCPHGKKPGEYCEPCNSSAIASGIPLNAPVSAKDDPKCDLINHRALAGCERAFQYCPYCGCNLAIVRTNA